MTDKTLSQMAKFDFTVPVKAVMVFDDSDDEENPSCRKRQKIDNPSKNSLELVEVNSSREGTNFPNRIETVELIGNKENEVCMTVTDDSDKNNQYNSYNIKTDILKPTKQNGAYCLQNKIDVCVSNGDEQCSKKQTHKNIPTSNENSEKVPKTTMPEQENIVSSFVDSDESRDKEVMSGYLKHLINSVSHHLLMILEAHYHNMNLRNCGNQTFIERSNIHFGQVKHHFFKLSYLVVESIFIPQVHSQIFSQHFIECTLRMAKKKSLNYSYEEIEAIYLEMLEWTKLKSVDFKKLALSYMSSKWHQSLMRSEIRKENVSNAYGHDRTSPRNKYKPGYGRNQNVANQPHHPVLQSDLRQPLLPSYEEVMQRNRAISNQNTFVLNNCQIQNNSQNITQTLVPPGSAYSGGNYDYNNLANTRHQGTTYSPNGHTGYQGYVHSHQRQYRNNTLQHATSSIQPLDPNNYTNYPANEII